MPIALALYQPDIPQNAGAILRTCACFGVEAFIIEPAGFPTSDRKLRRAGLDYLDSVSIARHASFAAFEDWRRAAGRRVILLTTSGDIDLPAARFDAGDIFMVGRETAGVSEEAHRLADLRIRIPMRAGMRSLNVASSAAVALYEALRQTGGLPT